MPAKLRQIAAAVTAAVALTTLLIPGTAAAASASIRFGMHIGSVGGCITVLSGPDNKTITLTWRDANGNLKGQATQTSPDIFFFCDTNLAAETGDKLKATDGTTTRKFTVPDLTLNLDRVTDTYYGTGPASRTVRLEIAQGDVGLVKSVRVNPDGTWSFHKDSLAIFGGNGAGLSWRSPKGDQVRTDGVAPYVIVTLGKPGFSGRAAPDQVVDVDLEDGVDASGSATANANGAFAGQFRDSAHHLRSAAVGDHLLAPSLASDADWIVPAIDGAADAATDIVSGQCHDTGTSGGIFVELYRTGHRRGYVLGPDSQPDGSFSFDFQYVGNFYANPANVKHGDQIVIQCRQITGDIAQLKFIIP